MIDRHELIDRHARPVAGLDVGADGIVVRIFAGPLEQQADQHLLGCLVNLLCRMVGSVRAIELHAPDVPITVPLPIGSHPKAAFDAMRDLAQWAVGDVVSVRRVVDTNEYMTISLDPSKARAEVDLYVQGDGWIAWVGTTPPAPSHAADVANPIGPYFAACLAAGEVFKKARGLLRGRFANDDGYSLWDGGSGKYSQLIDGPALDSCILPSFYLIGAGAVGQGVIAVLGASKLGSFAVTVDDDTHDGTNLNRCFVAGTVDVGHPKVEAVARFRSTAGLNGTELYGTLQQLVRRGPLAEMPDDLRANQSEDCFDIIVSAVDRNTSRWDIQGLRPGLIVGGSTDGLTAKAMLFDKRPGQPCLACNNLREEDGARLRTLERTIRGLSDDDAHHHLEAQGLGQMEIKAVLDFIRDAPACGSLGEQILGSMATSAPREFSVSFVSMAAAVLTFARLLRATSFSQMAPAKPVMSSISFRNLSMSDDAIARDPSCPFCKSAPN